MKDDDINGLLKDDVDIDNDSLCDNDGVEAHNDDDDDDDEGHGDDDHTLRGESWAAAPPAAIGRLTIRCTQGKVNKRANK